MRLFFALWPNDAERAALATATRAAVLEAGGRAVPQANLHVTLAFLGTVPAERLSEVRAAARGVQAAAFSLVLDRLERFARARVLAATASETPVAAAALAAQLREHLLTAGFEPDLKAFRPHVTLAREIGRSSDELRMASITLRCTEFVLVESRTERAGALYSVLDSWPLYEVRNA